MREAFTSFARATSTVKKAALFLFSVAALLTVGQGTARGQSAFGVFDPNANSEVLVVVVQPNGKILLGGNFTTLSPNGGAAVTRHRIARLNADGTLDTAFNPNASDAVYSIAVQADGKILAGGWFTSIGGATRNRIARLDASTGLADSFDPNANGSASSIEGLPSSNVLSIAVQADGRILAAGYFHSIGGQPRNHIARLDATTGLADSFNPNANGEVDSIAVQADGKILAGGFFTSIGGQTRHFFARLEATTGLADSLNPNANSNVFSIVVQADGKILAGGNFNGANSIGGQTRNFIARIDATTGLADSFNPNAGGGFTNVYSIAVQADDKILAGGSFTTIGGQPRNQIARLDATTGLADSFNPNADDAFAVRVKAIAVQADGKILAGGSFTTIGGQPRNRIARLENDGRVEGAQNRGDFNSDGFTDYLLFNANTRRTAIWNLHGNAFQSGVYGPILPDGWTVACVVDVNRDGKPDYILFNDTTRRTAIWYLSGATLINTVFGPTLPPDYQLIAASDVNRDTHVDYVLFNLSTHRTAFWFLNGNAVVTGTVFGPTLPAGWMLIDSLDFNSDGKPDLLLSQLSPSIRPTAIWYLDGAAHTTSAFGPTQPLGWALAGAADFNNDGKPDYVLFEPATRRTAQWYLDGVTRVGSAFGPMLPAGYSLASP